MIIVNIGYINKNVYKNEYKILNNKHQEKEETIKSSENVEHSEDFIFRLPLFSVHFHI